MGAVTLLELESLGECDVAGRRAREHRGSDALRYNGTWKHDRLDPRFCKELYPPVFERSLVIFRFK